MRKFLLILLVLFGLASIHYGFAVADTTRNIVAYRWFFIGSSLAFWAAGITTFFVATLMWRDG